MKAFEFWATEVFCNGKRAKLFINDEDFTEEAYVLVLEGLL